MKQYWLRLLWPELLQPGSVENGSLDDSESFSVPLLYRICALFDGCTSPRLHQLFSQPSIEVRSSEVTWKASLCDRVVAVSEAHNLSVRLVVCKKTDDTKIPLGGETFVSQLVVVL